MSEVLIYQVWAEQVFDWFYNSIVESGGDGAGAIVCYNPEETSENFKEWAKQIKDFDLNYRDKDCRNHDGKIYINYHDNNENWIFTNEYTQLFPHDIVFVIKEDCISGNTLLEKRFTILGITE